MKILKNKFIISLILFSLILVMPQVYAKTSIAIKPASTVYSNQTISEFFEASMKMKDVGEGLEGSNVDVHMAKNVEWAIVTYFADSAYGTNGAGKNDGIITSVDGKDYFSTNGNVTGVMNWGYTWSYTAGVISNYAEVPVDSEAYANGKSIMENASDGKYVDSLGNFTQVDMALLHRGAENRIGNKIGYPYSVRRGLFGSIYGDWLNEIAAGHRANGCTFRPVIFNKI